MTRVPLLRLYVAVLAALALGLAAASASAASADLDGDGKKERVTRAAFGKDGLTRVRLVDRDARRALWIGAPDVQGIVRVRDFAKTGRPQIFSNSSSGASGQVANAFVAEWNGSRKRFLWRLRPGRTPGNTVVRGVRVKMKGRTIVTTETLVPAGSPGCCPDFIRFRSSKFVYSASRKSYVRRATKLGPRRNPASI